eukprot:GILJ01016053.1.p1 GENE.GILJ01016053.1~~GILJ01016053.1.p1  ORF type:complete len:388 (+),score=45.02 GILJ01016053.1:1236-2399(+)
MTRPTVSRQSVRKAKPVSATNAAPKECLKAMRQVDIKRTRAEAVARTVQPSTLRSYLSEVRKLMTLLKHRTAEDFKRYGMKKPDKTPDDSDEVGMATFVGKETNVKFFTAYGKIRAKKGEGNFEKTRSALLKCQAMYSDKKKDNWAGSDSFRKLIAGLENIAKENKEPQRQRGAITEAILSELTAVLTKQRAKFVPILSIKLAADIANAMEIQFGAALRIKELIGLTAKDITDTGIVLVKEKQQKAMKVCINKPVEKNLMEWEWGKKAHKALQVRAQRYPTGLLFPLAVWNMDFYNSTIRQASDLAGLERRFGVDISGSHSLRHGGMGAIKTEKEATWTTKQMGEAARVSVQTFGRYSKPNHLRDAVFRERDATYKAHQKSLKRRAT